MAGVLSTLINFLLFVGLATADNYQSWQKYVRAPSTRTMHPKSILATNGSVTNAEALIGGGGGGVATLHRPESNDTVPSITLDFGLNIVGFLSVDFAGASANHPGVRLVFSETQEYLTNVSDFTRSDNGDTITPGTDQYAVPSEPTVWTDVYGCLYNGTQVCADGLHGFRYVRIELDALASDAPYTSPTGTVNISAVSLNYTAFLGTPDTFTGWFECSDQQLTQWWYDAAYTNDMVIDHFDPPYVDPRDAASPTLNGKIVLMDGAKRDRDPYVGDVAVSGRTLYLTHDIAEAAKNVIADLADHQRADGWIPPASINNYTLPLFDYPLWWVSTSWDYVLYTGDTDYAAAYYSNLQAVLDRWYPSVTNDHHLLSKGLNNTSGYGDYAFLPRSGEVTYYNALYVLALQNAAAWASELGDKSASTRWTQRAAQVSQAINANLWDASVGAFVDTSNITDTVRHAQDGNSISILAGVANASRSTSALHYLSTLHQFYGNAFYDKPLPGVDNATQRVYAFISYFELEARFATNQDASAFEELRRLYGWMASQDPQVTMWEGIGPNGSKYEQGYTSCAHGWSTGILPLLSNSVLGVRPTAPGFKSWEVRPHVGDLAWARGTVPTPHGPIAVSWNVGRRELTLSVDVPSGTNGRVCVPRAYGHRLYLNGRRIGVRQLSSDDAYVCINNVRPGRQSLSCS